jgi:hypothetical protein
MPGKPTFYTAFSNSLSKDDNLPNLSEESAKISDLLLGLVFSDAIYYLKDELFTAERLISNFSKYGDKFNIFYFSGHAQDGKLLLSDNFLSNIEPMADVINVNLKNLQCAFFNACKTLDLARKIVEKRLQSNTNTNKLVLIVSGCDINTFMAERFATHFFTHAGRPGTYYDAYQNAGNLMRFMNDKLRFREFRTYEELAAANDDFDYAFIDINVPDPKAEQEKAPAGTPEKPPPSIINVDKKTQDVLSANYLKESTQTILESKQLGQKETDILENAINATEQLAKGDMQKNAARTLWKKAASIIPGLNSGKDFQSLVNIYNGEYDIVMNKLTTSSSQQPTIQNIQEAMKSVK